MTINDQKRDASQIPLVTKLNLETAQITWKELEPFFAAGKVVAVDAALDLLLVAEQMVADNAAKMQEWMERNLVGQLSDDQAMVWSEQQAMLWAVVIKPWVLVQQR